ncbi:MAG: DUF2065 domain-containing protein [Desulfuromonadales bacterium]|nr:DUF2065 domain-containing protein [Desulfuromonadales bacterium]
MIVEGIPWFLSPGGYKRFLLQVFPLGETPLRLLGLSFHALWIVPGLSG